MLQLIKFVLKSVYKINMVLSKRSYKFYRAFNKIKICNYCYFSNKTTTSDTI